MALLFDQPRDYVQGALCLMVTVFLQWDSAPGMRLAVIISTGGGFLLHQFFRAEERQREKEKLLTEMEHQHHTDQLHAEKLQYQQEALKHQYEKEKLARDIQHKNDRFNAMFR